MITVREAVELASEFGHEIFHKSGTIEEVEIDDKYLFITLGFETPAKTKTGTTDVTMQPSFLDMFNPKTEKSYKIFKIDGEKKQVVSAKIRKL